MDLFFGGTGTHDKTKCLEKSAVYFRVVRDHTWRFKIAEASTLKEYKLIFQCKRK